MKEPETTECPRILIVEDDPVISRGLRTHLKQLGYDVAAIVPTGEQAVERTHKDLPDLVLMDIKLAGSMDGIDAAGAIRSSFNVPIIFVTAYSDHHLVERAKDTGPFAFLVKPVGKGELHRAVEIALHKAEEEHALVIAKEEWERTFDAVPDPIMVLDTEHRIVRANVATSRKLGITMERVVGDKCYRLFHGTDSPPSFCPHSMLLSDGKPRMAEVYEPYLKGTFEISVSPLFDTDGRVLASIHVAHDITERKIHENKQAQLLDEIKHFAYIVSHDLRAPLANLKGFAKELEAAIEAIRPGIEVSLEHLSAEQRSRVKSSWEEDIPESLWFIKSSVSRMSHLISAILRLSRLGHTELNGQRLDMNELIEQTVHSFAHQISQTRGEVAVGKLPEIVADRTSVEQIVGNLLDNAVKYLDPDRPGHIEISGWTDGGEAFFRIQDNGLGIEESDLDRIFQVFQRSGNKDVPGEGMGLAYVRTLVRRHGGRIWCESQPGVGSAFTFTISNHILENTTEP